MSCVGIQGGYICGPNDWVEFHRESLGQRWCFAHRGRTEFIYTVEGESGLSYYEPTPGIRCTECGTEDGDVGFGQIRDWWGEFDDEA